MIASTSTIILRVDDEDPSGPKMIYFGLPRTDSRPLQGCSAVLRTLIGKFMQMAFDLKDICGENIYLYQITESILYRSAVRLVVYAHSIKCSARTKRLNTDGRQHRLPHAHSPSISSPEDSSPIARMRYGVNLLKRGRGELWWQRTPRNDKSPRKYCQK